MNNIITIKESKTYEQGRISFSVVENVTYYILDNGIRLSINQIDREIFNRKVTPDYYKIYMCKSINKKIAYFKKHLESIFMDSFFSLKN